jgi:transposase
MLTTTGPQKIYLDPVPVDMRAGFDRLAARVLAAGFDLYAGHLFVFLSKRRSHCKVLTWDQNGLLILFKRIEVGRFHLPVVPEGVTRVSLDATSLAVLLQGIDLKALPAARSWSPPPRGSTADPACDLVRP